jgi:hypothetical protein
MGGSILDIGIRESSMGREYIFQAKERRNMENGNMERG